jgi:hypothetical protein
VSTLESIVLPLADSRALVEHGIVLDTAMVWAEMDGGYQCDENGDPQQEMPPYADVVPGDSPYHGTFICLAPVLSELLDAIRAKADAMETKVDRGMKLERHEWDGKIDWELVGQGKGNCEDDWREAEGKDSTDLLAAAALLLEVSK